MRTEFIQTKVRPIKKMFIIEPSNFELFSKVFNEIQDEIDVPQNLLFVNDSDLWSQPNKDFVKRSDPDIIFNLSTLDEDRLSRHFEILSVKPTDSYFKISRFGTSLIGFTRRPLSVEKFLIGKDEEIRVLTAAKLENTPESLSACINYGLLEEGTKEHLGFTIFKKIKAVYLTKVEDIIGSLFENEDKYSNITSGLGALGGSGNGTSIYEVDYNREGLFIIDKKHFFVSRKNDFKTISFFWNTRSYYSYAKLAWIPIELISAISPLVDSNTIFVCFDAEIETQVKKQYGQNEIVKPARLHFRGRNERWTFFEEKQIIHIASNEVIVQHPGDKNFSDVGYGGPLMLEIRGLKEFAYPKRRVIGNLFIPKYYDKAIPSEAFFRLSELGLAKWVLQLRPLGPTDITAEIVLPSFSDILHSLFKDIGYNLKETPKSSILEQTINLVGGIEELAAICEKNVFKLIVTLTPKVRTENVLKKLLPDSGKNFNSDNVLEILDGVREKGDVSFPSVTLTLEEITDKAAISRDERNKLLPTLQRLYDQRIFLRGKFFECPYCKSKLWIQIHEIARVNYCSECGNVVNLPIFSGDKQESDHFRLNQLIVRAVDQGQLSTLLLLNLFYQQKYAAFEYLSNIEVLKDDSVVTDVDLVIKIGRKIGIAECKSSTCSTEKQVDALINIASAMKFDFVAFSSLVDSNTQELREFVDILDKKGPSIPVFVFTNEVLFMPIPGVIQKAFELRNSEGFKTGPIVVVKQ